MLNKKYTCIFLLFTFLAFQIFGQEVVLIELEKKTEKALGFYPWDQERQIKLISIILERKPKALLSLLPKLDLDDPVKELIKDNPSLFVSSKTKEKNMAEKSQIGEFKHQAEEVLLYDTTKNYKNVLFSLIEFLKLFKSEKNISWTYKANLNISEHQRMIALDFFTLDQLPDLKDKVVILAYHGRNQVKEKSLNFRYSHPGDVAATILVEMIKNSGKVISK